MPHRRTPLALLTAVLAITAVSARPYPRALDPFSNITPKVVGIQLFQWNWDSIAAECTNFIGPAGYGFVQVSPPAEHVEGNEWFTDYQPVSYKIESKRGSRVQFAGMVATCHAAGVQVIADTILNHMTGRESGRGVAGSSFTLYDYPGIYQIQDFHHCGLTPDDDIKNFDDRDQVQRCELLGLSDLATDTSYVQDKLASYINDLLSLGVDGLRLDAAKHVPSGDIRAILSRVNGKPYITQETTLGAVDPGEYAANGDVQEFRYTTRLKEAFQGQNGGLASLRDLNSQGWVNGINANVFVANHDTERDRSSLTFRDSNNDYVLAMIFSLAYPYGRPTILSSYEFPEDNFGAGAPNSGSGQCSGNTGGWLCQHRLKEVVGLVGFRNQVQSADLNGWTTGNNAQIAFSRGNQGFIAINAAGDAWSTTFNTPLADGTYCDVASGSAGGTLGLSCTGSSFTVAQGKITMTIPPHSAIALHSGAKSLA